MGKNKNYSLEELVDAWGDISEAVDTIKEFEDEANEEELSIIHSKFSNALELIKDAEKGKGTQRECKTEGIKYIKNNLTALIDDTEDIDRYSTNWEVHWSVGQCTLEMLNVSCDISDKDVEKF